MKDLFLSIPAIYIPIPFTDTAAPESHRKHNWFLMRPQQLISDK